jgi:hypothetical protein
MNDAVHGLTPAEEARAFAAERGATEALEAVLGMTRQVFVGCEPTLGLELDPDIPDDPHIVIHVRGVRMSVEQASEARWAWCGGLVEVCPGPLRWVFRLGMEIAG